MNLFFCICFDMDDFYRTIEKPAEGLFRDRNSKFLAFGFPVSAPDQIPDILTTLRKKYHDARHHCYAYRIGPHKDLFKFNDDGEPSGTAGKPIYNQIVANDLSDVLVVVVRYFGGTLLGTGGLINAYKSASAEMFLNASFVVKYIETCYLMEFPYEKMNVVMKILKEENLIPLEPMYGESCSLKVHIRKGRTEGFLKKTSVFKEINLQICKQEENH